MNTGLLHSLLDAQPSTPAGEPPLKVVMIDRKNIIVNPDNRKIYVIGDVSRLKEDIRVHGIRQPLEVVDLENGDYKLIGGERRLTACEELAKEGDTRFNALPCVILRLKQDDDDKIALITANATARELTDGERLAQYEALKEILTRRKKNGQLEGKARDELCRILGLSAGAAARLNAIAENCGDDTKRELRAGEISLMAAYKRAQEIIEAKKQPVEPPKPEKMIYEKPVIFDCPPKAAETIPECRVAVEKAHREAAQKQEEQQRGKKTLKKLAEKMIDEDAPWELFVKQVMFQLAYYSQPLPGGAKLWMRRDEIRKEANFYNADSYAITLQDNTFFSKGWESEESIIERLTKYFELK